MPGITTNPNLGRGLGYDSRTDLGYGKNSNSGLGSSWPVTGNAGIYKEKSYYEKELDKDVLEDEDLEAPGKESINKDDLAAALKPLLALIGIDEEIEVEDEYKLEDKDIDEFEVSIDMKAHSSGNQAVSDFGSKYGTDPYSFNGLANTSQYLGAGYNRGNNMLKEFIREALQEEMLREVTSMSVRVMVKGTVGDTYKPSKSNVSNVNQMAPGDPSIKQHGYGQKAKTPAFYPYSDEGMPTTDGGEMMNSLDDDIYAEFDWEDEDYTTGDFLYDTSTRDYFDQKNVSNHIKRTKRNLKEI